MKMMILLMIVFAFAIGYATLIEDKYDTPAAKILIFNAGWFEMLLILLGINLMGGIINYKMWRKEKWGQLTFHVAFIIILLGAGITRVAGYEGVMQIKEGEASNRMFSAEPYLQAYFYDVNDLNEGTGQVLHIREDRIPMWLSEATPRKNNFNKSFDVPGKKPVEMSYNWYITDRVLDVVDGNGEGDEYILLRFSKDPKDSLYIKSGSIRFRRGVKYAFNNSSETDAIQFSNTHKGEVYMQAPYDIQRLDQSKLKQGLRPMEAMDSLDRDMRHRFIPRMVHTVAGAQFWYASHFTDAKMVYRKTTQTEKDRKQGTAFLSMHVAYNGHIKDVVFEGKSDLPTRFTDVFLGDVLVKVGYGPRIVQLPFYVRNVDFRLENYPGSQKASSYECDLMVLDSTRNKFYKANVYMNHVMDHGGFRFFQSSYSISEEAQINGGDYDITVLSVNHDFWGSTVTYIGYLLMALGFIWTLFKKNSRFGTLVKKLKAEELKSKKIQFGLVGALLSFGAYSQTDSLPNKLFTDFDENYVEKSERIMVQTYGGRISPLHTHARDVLYKVYKKSTYNGLSAMEVYLSMMANPQPWYSEKMIKIGHPEVRDLLDIKEGVYASMEDFIDPEYFAKGQEVWKKDLDELYNEAKKTRDVQKSSLEKELIKAVDRYQVLRMALGGDYFRVFPIDIGTTANIDRTELDSAIAYYLQLEVPIVMDQKMGLIKQSAVENELIEIINKNVDLRKSQGDEKFKKHLKDVLLNGPVNTDTWVSIVNIMDFREHITKELGKCIDLYWTGFRQGVEKGDWQAAVIGVQTLKDYQRSKSPDIIPSKTLVSIEILYNKLNIFMLLLMIYTTIGILYLIVVAVDQFSLKYLRWARNLRAIFFAVIVVGMLFHTLGLGMRWYITGHAPWSNGYEALLFIGLATMIAGTVFNQFTKFALPAAVILAGLILGIAHGASVDPELTNLVPVLKSYWLVIHVAVITASYGFLGLGAILALINIFIYALSGSDRPKHINTSMDQVTRVIELTLTIGVYMAAIGTFLGGVWANESWGRYWGWDAKETWALVIVIVYSIILHFRFIPFLKQKIAFNAAALLGVWTVIMTYWGVNYLLTKGLHSYARGEGAGIPGYIIGIFIGMLVLIGVAIVQDRRYRRSKQNGKF